MSVSAPQPLVRPTNSAKLREEGNKLYALGNNESLAPVLRKARYEEAISKYNQALNSAVHPDDIASATKNVGAVSTRMANLLVSRKEPISSIKFYFKQAITSFSTSYNCASTTSCKTLEWQAVLTQAFYRCIEDAVGTLDDLPFGEKMSFYEEYVYLIDFDSLRAEFCLKIGTKYFHESLRQIADKDFKNGLRYLHECYRPTEEAARAGKEQEDTMIEVDILREDVRLNTYTAESMQAISIGDKLYDDYELEQSGEVSAVNMIWEVLDWYKQAVLLTRESDVEVEAIAISRIGRVYDKALTIRSKARENFKKAVQLALSLHPRTFTNDAWYKECTETLERFQKEQVEQEDQKWNKERQKYVEGLKDELDELEKKAKIDDVEFLKFLYEKHPPLDGRHTLSKQLPNVKDGGIEFRKLLKGILRKAVIHYHPDRCDVKKHGEKRKVLNEEITKILTKKYEVMKC